VSLHAHIYTLYAQYYIDTQVINDLMACTLIYSFLKIKLSEINHIIR